jgi:hypothetical protein
MKKGKPPDKTRDRVTEREARAGLKETLPPIETFSNQFPGYEIKVEIPEFTSARRQAFLISEKSPSAMFLIGGV